MKAIILDGSQRNDRTGQRVRAALTAEPRSQDWDVEAFTMCEQKIGACAGDFFCWIRTPGMCNVNDDNRDIRIRRALELATEALGQGQVIPEDAREMMAKPVIPHWLYRLTGWLRWNRWAKDNGAKKLLKQQPYLAKAG